MHSVHTAADHLSIWRTQNRRRSDLRRRDVYDLPTDRPTTTPSYKVRRKRFPSAWNALPADIREESSTATACYKETEGVRAVRLCLADFYYFYLFYT